MSDASLVFLAGNRALETIRAQGLESDHVKVVAGAAGGPKWLILAHWDRMLFGNWFRERQAPLHLLGSSIGSWRFAAASCADPVAAIDRMEDAYIHQAYDHHPPPREISEKSRAIIDVTLGADGPAEVLAHPANRLNVLAVRSRHLAACEQRLPLALGLAAAALANGFSRRSLKWFFRQTLFSDPRTPPPFLEKNRWPDAESTLSRANLSQALTASGSIPYVMQGVHDIPGAAPGVYRDGGAVDYHLDVPFGLNGRGIVLYPHFSQRIIPGWLDKKISWRRPSTDNMADVLLAAPSDSFVARLPNGKITDRKDFFRYAGNDKARFSCWRQAAEAGRILSEDFMEAVTSGSIRHRVQPLTAAKRPF